MEPIHQITGPSGNVFAERDDFANGASSPTKK